jgi:hypothetical protein
MQKLYKNEKYKFIYSNCILHPYGSSNYNTKAYKHIKEKQHKHNKYVNVQLSFWGWTRKRGQFSKLISKKQKKWNDINKKCYLSACFYTKNPAF